MSRKITLYRNCRILEDKNMQVDNIKYYLETLQTKVYPNAIQTAEPQIIKNINDIDLTIKVEMNQEDYLEKNNNLNQYNYVSINLNENYAQTNIYYYFIRKINWKSQKCAELELHMDVLNTFKGEYTLTDKTTIQRMHKDRFINHIHEDDLEFVKQGTQADWVEEGIPPYITENLSFSLDDSFTGINIKQSEVKLYVKNTFNPGIYDLIDNTEWEWVKESDLNYKIVWNTHYHRIINDYQINIEHLGGVYCLSKIDDVPEGIQGAVQYKINDTAIKCISSFLNQPWYLIYSTPSTPTSNSPVDCFLVPKTKIKLKNIVGSVTWNKSAFIQNKYYFFTFADNTYASLQITGSTTWNYTLSDGLWMVVFMRDSDDVLHVWRYEGASGDNPHYVELSGTQNSVTFSNIQGYRWDSSNHSNPAVVNNLNYTSYPVGTVTIYSTEINDFDLTDAKIIKVLELPYSPISLSYNNNTLQLPTGWSLDIQRNIKLDNTKFYEFEHNLDLNITLPLIQYVSENNWNIWKNRGILVDPKIYSTEFYTCKFVYDDATQVIALEKLNYTTEPNLTITYKQSNTVSSSLGFKINFNNCTYTSTQDYGEYIFSKRSLEKNLFTNAWIDYTRTGYNFDKKQLQNQKAQIVTNTVVDIAGAAVGAAFGGSSGAGGAIGASQVTGAIKGIANNIFSIVNAEESQRAKETQLKYQATTVNGCDDLNLLDWYSDNKLHLIQYQVSDKLLESVSDLFYYYGYAVNYQGIPNTTSRNWFNYIQCDPVYDTNSTKVKLNKECLDELTNKYRNGVTVYHQKISGTTKMWDFDQVKENWEESLI